MLCAFGSAMFASLTAILGKVGIQGVESNLGTAIRTGVVLVMAWVMVLLTSKEYALLEYLLRHQGQTLTRSQISDHVWNFDFDYDSNIVDVYIRYLRNKVDKPFPNKLIHTVRGFGYVMRCGDA